MKMNFKAIANTLNEIVDADYTAVWERVMRPLLEDECCECENRTLFGQEFIFTYEDDEKTESESAYVGHCCLGRCMECEELKPIRLARLKECKSGLGVHQMGFGRQIRLENIAELNELHRIEGHTEKKWYVCGDCSKHVVRPTDTVSGWEIQECDCEECEESSLPFEHKYQECDECNFIFLGEEEMMVAETTWCDECNRWFCCYCRGFAAEDGRDWKCDFHYSRKPKQRLSE